MALLVKKDDIPRGTIKVKSQGPQVNLTTSLVYGNSCSIMMAERPSGYHTIPHVHECEQFNVILEGEVYIFIEEDAYLLQAGDMHRVPSNALHWAWNKGDGPCKMLEVHAPGLQGDDELGAFALGLFADGEEMKLTGNPKNIFVENNPVQRAIAEAKAK